MNNNGKQVNSKKEINPTKKQLNDIKLTKEQLKAFLGGKKGMIKYYDGIIKKYS